MKKVLTILLTVVLFLLAFTACIPTQEGVKDITIILIDYDGVVEEYSFTSEAIYLDEVLDEMVLEDIFTISTSGGFLNAIGHLTPTGEGLFIAVYTDIDDELLISIGYTTEYNDKTYYLTGFGINEMPIFDKCSFIFRIESWL